MTPRGVQERLTRWGRGLGLALVLGWVAPGPAAFTVAHAAPAPKRAPRPPTVYTKIRSFRIPFIVEPADRAIALDRARLERDGSIYSGRYPLSNFYRRREEAVDETVRPEQVAFDVLGIRVPCTVDDIKAAYRRRALEVHPDRGGSQGDFLAVEDAYRSLMIAARD